MVVPPVNVSYTIKAGVEDDSYADFIDELRDHLAKHLDAVRYNVEGHPVLPEQRTPARPKRWIYIHLATGDTCHRVTLAVRDDNVYVKGFRNQREGINRWYEFGFENGSTRLLPRSTFLECEYDYPSLIGGSTFNLKRVVDLCKGEVMEAVRRLSVYWQPVGGVVDDATKLDLARLFVVVCESARMIPHFRKVNNSWRQSVNLRTMLDEEQVSYLLNWGNMSQALMEWNWYKEKRDDDSYWPHDLTEKVAEYVDSSDRALGVVKLLLQRKLFWRPTPPVPGRRRRRHAATAQGHPLLEVFAVRAAGSRLDGTIAVFDGKRGQIIYRKPVQAGVVEADAAGQGWWHAISLAADAFARAVRGLFVLRDAIVGWVFAARHTPVQDELSGRGLLLTGPYRAICASGCVSIEVDPTATTDGDPATADDESASGDGMLLWDYYDEANAVYDKPLTGTFHTAHGPVAVTYAVLSDAVQATVQVYLVPAQDDAGGATTAHDILVHGITARSKVFDVVEEDTDLDARCVLFSRDSGEKVAASPGYLVPMVRSVLAVPFGFPLLIETTLQASVASSNQEGVSFTVTAEFHPETSGKKTQSFSIVHDERQVSTATLILPSTEEHNEEFIPTPDHDSVLLVKVIWESDL